MGKVVSVSQPPPEDPDATAPAVLGDSALQSQTLESIASAVNYHAWLTDLARPFLGDRPVELGSGLGDYAARWLASGVPSITLTDLDPSRLGVLRDRFGADPRVTITQLDVLDPPEGEYSSFVAFNVLEHIPDHVAALASAHRLVVPGGAVIMFVPAFEAAMSDFDRKVGHVRRYTKATLAATFQEAGLRVESVRYVNAPGLPAWYVGMRLLKMTPGEGALLRVWDKVVIPSARAVERRVRPPFGQSVFAVGRVPR